MSSRLPVALALLGALALAACGVKGPLEPPETGHQTPAPAAARTVAPGQGTAAGQGTTTGQAATPNAASTSNQAAMSRLDTQEGELAWGANPTSGGLAAPPNTPGNSISRPAKKNTNPADNKPFFLDFLL